MTAPAPVDVIVVPLEDSLESFAALPVARRLAEIVGAELHVVCATEGRELDTLAARFGIDPSWIRGVVIDRIQGDPVERITEAATKHAARFICTSRDLGADLTAAKPEHGLEALLTGAPCPVVLVPAGRGLRQFELTRVVLPLDGDPHAAACACAAMGVVVRARAELYVLHVAEAHPAAALRGTVGAPRYVDHPQHEWPAWSREFSERMCALAGVPAEMPVRVFLRRGAPAQAILQFASERSADLVIVAWRGVFAGTRASTLKAVLKEAPCPVVVSTERAHACVHVPSDRRPGSCCSITKGEYCC